MEKLSTARQIIEHTDFAEFPETVTHARLCAAFARLDAGRYRKRYVLLLRRG